MEKSTAPNLEKQEGARSGLHRVITLRHAVALYVSSLLGSGIFVIPGLEARIAGPASILSWIILSIASYPFAYTFAKLSARRPESGGIYVFAREGLGIRASAATAWLFLAWAVLGAPAATVAAASYLEFVFPVSRADVFLVAAGILIAAFVVNYLGIRFTGRVQLATVAAILAALTIAVVASVPRVSPANFSRFCRAVWHRSAPRRPSSCGRIWDTRTRRTSPRSSRIPRRTFTEAWSSAFS